jgi:hypothetical protein
LRRACSTLAHGAKATILDRGSHPSHRGPCRAPPPSRV